MTRLISFAAIFLTGFACFGGWVLGGIPSTELEIRMAIFLHSLLTMSMLSFYKANKIEKWLSENV